MLLLYVWQPSRQSLYCSIRAIRTRNNTGDSEQFDKKALFFLFWLVSKVMLFLPWRKKQELYCPSGCSYSIFDVVAQDVLFAHFFFSHADAINAEK
jgi:hypothetical protein